MTVSSMIRPALPSEMIPAAEPLICASTRCWIFEAAPPVAGERERAVDAEARGAGERDVGGERRAAVGPGCHVEDVPPVAAVCVYPDLAGVAVERLAGSGVVVAAVATAFPSGRSSLPVKLADTAFAVDAGAGEIDMVIDRGAFLTGRYGLVYDEIVAVKEVCGRAHLKVILETGELAGYDDVRRASWLALLAGADVIKTSTGKVSPAATLPVVQVMLQAVRDWHRATGDHRGVKAAGGIRTAKDAVRHLVAVNEVAGPAWLTPDLFRFGASSLLNDLLRQRRAQTEGHYAAAKYIGTA